MMTDMEFRELVTKIFKMDQITMARLLRFAQLGHPVFDKRNYPLHEIFQLQFEKLGGMTPDISKEIGRG